jgi:hypothetical protein
VSDPKSADDPDGAVEAEVIEAEVVAPEVVAPEVVAPEVVAPEETGYTAAGVPTFDSVREKIETRYGTAIGSAELAAETPQGRTIEDQYEARQKAAAERLEQIRASMRDEPDA